MAVVIQNSRESKLIYGADVSGTVFKEISDRLYTRFIGNVGVPTFNSTDSLLYNSLGIKNDLQSIFSFMNIGFKDSAAGGYWRNMQMKNNAAFMNTPNLTTTQSRITPLVIGMGLKDAVYLLENKGLSIQVQGRGRVVDQSLAAGTNFIKGQKISLLLN